MFDDIGVGITITLKNLEEVQGALRGIRQITNKMKNVPLNLKLPTSSKQALSTTRNAFRDIFSSVKKLGFALLTVRGIWFAIRKAMTTYLSLNDELSSKLNGLYFALGSMFAPALEWLVNTLAYGLYFINEIVKALGFAGINMENLGRATGSTAKKMKSLLSIDEINNLSSNSSGGGGSASSIGNPFADIDTNAGIFKFLDKIRDKLAEIGKIIKTSFTLTAKLFAGEPLTRDEIKFKIIESLGLIGLGAVAMAIDPRLGLVLSTVGVLDLVMTLQNALKNGKILSKDDLLKCILASLGLGVLGASAIALGLTGTGITLSIAGAILLTWSLSSLLSDKGTYSGIIPTSLGIDVDAYAGASLNTSDYVNAVKNINRKKYSLDTDTSKGGKKILAFASGTNYVPNDQLAYIHQGEAIVPKEFNPNAFYGETSAEELSLLAQINEQLVELNRKNFDVSLDGESLATKVNNTIQNMQYRNGQRVFAIER